MSVQNKKEILLELAQAKADIEDLHATIRRAREKISKQQADLIQAKRIISLHVGKWASLCEILDSGGNKLDVLHGIRVEPKWFGDREKQEMSTGRLWSELRQERISAGK